MTRAIRGLAPLLLAGLLLSIAACGGPRLPRFARPPPYDAGAMPDAAEADADGGS